jgi:hypothetical protein
VADPSARRFNELGNERRSAGDLEGAASLYRRALCADGNFASAPYNLALCLREVVAGAPGASLRRQVEALRTSCSGVFDTSRFARSLEAAYEAMWRNHLDGRPPRSIEIPP